MHWSQFNFGCDDGMFWATKRSSRSPSIRGSRVARSQSWASRRCPTHPSCTRSPAAPAIYRGSRAQAPEQPFRRRNEQCLLKPPCGAPPTTGRERTESRSRPASPERATHVRTARASEHPGAGPGFHTFPRGRSARLLSGPPRQPVDQCHQPRAAGGTRQCAWRTRSPVAGQPVTAARGKVLGAPPRGQPRRHEISGPAPPAAGPGRGG